jgi:hypothetical protein
MSMSANEDPSAAESQGWEGEILKASAPGPDQVQIGMDVMSMDGEHVGKVKAIHSDEFLVDRRMARDLWIPFSALFSVQDYNSNFRRGPAEEASVVLEVTHANIDHQGWRHD